MTINDSGDVNHSIQLMFFVIFILYAIIIFKKCIFLKWIVATQIIYIDFEIKWICNIDEI